MKTASTHSHDGSEEGDDGQPRRVMVKAGKVPLPATTGVRSVFEPLGAPTGKRRGGLVKPLPPLDIDALKPVTMVKPPKPMPPHRKGTKYDAVFTKLGVGQMVPIDMAYQAAIRRVMVDKNRTGPQRYSMRTLHAQEVGLWRDV